MPASDMRDRADAPRPVPAPETARAAALIVANINPRTGLATDYLNHFNEAIMLLDMIPAMPDCVAEFLAWRPLTYPEHFAASTFRGRGLAIEAYRDAEPRLRAQFDGVCASMTAILLAIGNAMRAPLPPATCARLAEQALVWLRPLVAQAGGLINGEAGTAADAGNPQGGVDRILAH
jgi:hypothetical protein